MRKRRKQLGRIRKKLGDIQDVHLDEAFRIFDRAIDVWADNTRLNREKFEYSVARDARADERCLQLAKRDVPAGPSDIPSPS